VTYDRDFWEERWSEVPPSRATERPPNAHLRAEAEDLRPGRALDAGCGHGSDALWLAARGWQVTGVDFSATALAHARAAAEATGAEIEWVEGDLATWARPPGQFDLVVSLYVHVAGSVEEMVRRMAAGVAPGGTLLMVGHHPARDQVQVSVGQAVAAPDPDRWELVVAEDRPRAAAGTGIDAVIRARNDGADD
jgi:SAM-dependent methyltransferase